MKLFDRIGGSPSSGAGTRRSGRSARSRSEGTRQYQCRAVQLSTIGCQLLHPSGACQAAWQHGGALLREDEIANAPVCQTSCHTPRTEGMPSVRRVPGAQPMRAVAG